MAYSNAYLPGTACLRDVNSDELSERIEGSTAGVSGKPLPVQGKSRIWCESEADVKRIGKAE